MATDAARRPVVAVVGSIDPARPDRLELHDVERAPAACEALGRALAEQDVDIVVYSGRRTPAHTDSRRRWERNRYARSQLESSLLTAEL